MLTAQFFYLFAKALISAIGFGLAGYVSLLLLLLLLRRAGSAVKYHLSNMMLLINFLVFLFPFTVLLRYPAGQLQGGVVFKSSGGIDSVNVIASGSDAATGAASDLFQLISFKLLAYQDVMAALYLTGLTVFLLQLLYSYFRAMHLKKNGISPVSDHWTQQLASAMAKLNITKNIRIAFSSLVSSPCIIGHSKALILIPLALANQLTTQQVEAILLHELAHFRQYDHYINVLGRIICCILFFNPFAWLFLGLAKTYREYSCDELVARHGNSIALAESLVQISAMQTRSTSLSLGLVHQKNHLLHRIQNLLSMKKQPRSKMYVFGVPALTAIVLLSGAVLSFYSARAGKTKDLTPQQQLAAASNKMFDQGNDNYIFADALHDSLLQPHTDYSYTYADGQITINGKQLPGKMAAAYARKLEGFLTLYCYGGEYKLSNKGEDLNLEKLMLHNGAFSSPRDLDKKLTALSKSLYNEKNINFILVDALNDKLILAGQSFHFIYTTGDITLNGHALSADVTKRYADKLKAFYHDHGVNESSFWSVNSEGMTYETLFNPNNSFHRTAESVTATEPVSRKEQQDLLIGELAKDKIADTAKGFSLMYNIHGVFVDNKKLVGRMEKKYQVLCFNAFGHVPTNENESSSFYTGSASATPTGIKTGISEIDFK